MTITGGTALAQDEIDRMIREAESHAEEDRRRREAAEARNQADNVSYQTEKLLKEQADQLTDEERTRIENANDELRKLLEDESSSPEDLRRKTEEVLEASQALAQRLYQQQQSAGTAGGPTEATIDEDEVVEAEIVDEGEESA